MILLSLLLPAFTIVAQYANRPRKGQLYALEYDTAQIERRIVCIALQHQRKVNWKMVAVDVRISSGKYNERNE